MSWSIGVDWARAETTARAVHPLRPLRVAARCPAGRVSAHSVRRGWRSASPSRLGAAAAGTAWSWAGEPPLVRPPETSGGLGAATVIRVPAALLAEMARAAGAQQRDAGVVWAEAAREWLARRAHDDEPQPPDPTPTAAALPLPRVVQAWAAIDALLADLRRPSGAPAA